MGCPKQENQMINLTLNDAKELFTRPCEIARTNKSSNESLSYILINSDGYNLSAIGTNTIDTCKKSIQHISEPFVLCVDADHLLTVLENFNKAKLNISMEQLSESKVKIKIGKSTAQIACIDEAIYPTPVIPDESLNAFSFSGEQFIKELASVMYAKASNNTAIYLNHVGFSISQGVCSLKAANGHRLVTSEFEVPIQTNIKGIFPTGLCNQLIKLSPKGVVQFFYNQSQFYCKFDNTLLGSNFVSAEFPDVSNAIATEATCSVTVETRSLHESVSRFKAFVKSSKIPKLTLVFANGVLTLKTRSSDTNELDEELELNGWQGEATQEVNVSPSYLLDAINNINSENTSIAFTKSNCIKLNAIDSNQDAVVMAMR